MLWWRTALIGAAISVAAAVMVPAADVATEPPERVVSINLCTDQLALALARPGQLVSVSYLAADPGFSPVVDAVSEIHKNRTQAEDVFLQRPSLVLAGTYTSPVTTDMLEHLGIPVVRIAPAFSLDDIPDRLREIGALLGVAATAEAAAQRAEARIAALREAAHSGPRPIVALYHSRGYLSGSETLAGDILRAAGFDNVATRFDLPMGGVVPLEALVMAAPDLVVTGRQDGHSRADALLDHPALAPMRDATTLATDNRWACGTEAVLDVAEELARLRGEMVE